MRFYSYFSMNKIETTTYFTFDEVKHLPNNLEFIAEDDVFVHCKITMDDIAKKMILGSPENVEYIISVCDKDLNHYQVFNLKKYNKILKIKDMILKAAQTDGEVSNYLNSQGQYYFKPNFLAHKEGFYEFLKQKGIRYRGVIPFTTLISRSGKVELKYNGSKRSSYLRSKVIKEIF